MICTVEILANCKARSSTQLSLRPWCAFSFIISNTILYTNCSSKKTSFSQRYICNTHFTTIYLTLSHLISKESTGIHKSCYSGLFPIPRVHLKVDQRVQGNNFPEIHLNVHQCTSECTPVCIQMYPRKVISLNSLIYPLI